MTRRLLIAAALALLLLAVVLPKMRPKYRGEPLVELQLPGTLGGFWINPSYPILFHCWWGGRRLWTVPNPWYPRPRPGTYQMPIETPH